MNEDVVTNIIKEKINEFYYNSVNFQLALVNEEGLWKILLARFIFDSSDTRKHETLFKENNFALESFSLSIDEFNHFLDHLGKVHVGNIRSKHGKVNITDELLFKLGNYKLNFVGNFPSRDLYFYGRTEARANLGIDRPIYYTDYAIHDSGRIRTYPQLDLTGYDTPFRNVTELINHFWGTHYQQYSTPVGCGTYMPIFDASISGCKVKGRNLIVRIEIDKERVNIDQLSLGVIAEGQGNEYRRKHELHANLIEIDLGLVPNLASITLNRQRKKLDEFNYHSPEQQKALSNLAAKTNGVVVGHLEPASETDETMEIEKELLFDQDLIRKLPKQIQTLLTEIEGVFNCRLYRATAILSRITLEEGITLIIQRIGKENELYNNGFEIGLQQQIKILIESAQQFRQLKKDLDTIKWFGDKASHEASFPIYKDEISANIAPKLRLFLVKLLERYS